MISYFSVQVDDFSRTEILIPNCNSNYSECKMSVIFDMHPESIESYLVDLTLFSLAFSRFGLLTLVTLHPGHQQTNQPINRTGNKRGTVSKITGKLPEIRKFKISELIPENGASGSGWEIELLGS